MHLHLKGDGEKPKHAYKGALGATQTGHFLTGNTKTNPSESRYWVFAAKCKLLLGLNNRRSNVDFALNIIKKVEQLLKWKRLRWTCKKDAWNMLNA